MNRRQFIGTMAAAGVTTSIAQGATIVSEIPRGARIWKYWS